MGCGKVPSPTGSLVGSFCCNINAGVIVLLILPILPAFMSQPFKVNKCHLV